MLAVLKCFPTRVRVPTGRCCSATERVSCLCRFAAGGALPSSAGCAPEAALGAVVLAVLLTGPGELAFGVTGASRFAMAVPASAWAGGGGPGRGRGVCWARLSLTDWYGGRSGTGPGGSGMGDGKPKRLTATTTATATATTTTTTSTTTTTTTSTTPTTTPTTTTANAHRSVVLSNWGLERLM